MFDSMPSAIGIDFYFFEDFQLCIATGFFKQGFNMC